jgi:DNA-binding LacI/PurR family transcriptional regulator
MVKQAQKNSLPEAPDRSGNMDIRAVARLANVSISTVSRSINRKSLVNLRTAQRVWGAIAELNYFPNTQARAVVSGRSRLLGLIVSEITFPEVIQGFEDVAIEHGYDVLITSTNHDPGRMSLCIRRMLERRVEGVAVMTFGTQNAPLEQLAERKVPLVLVDVGPEKPGVSLLKVNYGHGIRQAVQHLTQLGHRDITFIRGPKDLQSVRSRQTAFTRTLQECGIGCHDALVVDGDHTLEGGMRAMDSLLKSRRKPTAVICSNDLTAIGVLHKLDRAGLRAPDDMSVIGFGNTDLERMTIPSLTTIQIPCFELGRAAVTALCAHVEGGTELKRDDMINTQLVVRESTGSPKGAMPDLCKPGRTLKRTPTAAPSGCRSDGPLQVSAPFQSG